jgi:ribosome recycling factor
MTYDFSAFKRSSEGALEWLRKEYTSIRTGRAAPAILDSVMVNAYGSKTPINQVATISIEGPKSLRISPWDKSVAKEVDSAIREANLGVSVVVDDQGLRVTFPDLTSDRRALLIKTAKEKLEEARITLRTEREKVITDVDKKEKAGEISQDDKFRYKAELQKMVDEANRKLDEIIQSKEKEINE